MGSCKLNPAQQTTATTISQMWPEVIYESGANHWMNTIYNDVASAKNDIMGSARIQQELSVNGLIK